MASRSTTINTGALQRLLRGRNGPVGRMMAGFAGLSTRACREVAVERLSGRSSGRYYRGIRSTTVGSPQGVRVVTSAPSYGGAPDRPTRPHEIRPRRARVLRFRVGGRVVYARRVRHPGTEGLYILRDGVRRAGRQLDRLARR